MTVTVVLCRYPEDTPRAGELTAYVIQEDQRRGHNLLAGIRATGVPYAQEVVKREIRRIIPGVQITFEGPG
jgi:hypothetical protein